MGVPARPAAGPVEPEEAYEPPEMTLTTLGWLKHLEDPAADYFEWQYLKNIHRFLTARWWLLQSGTDREALKEWLLIMKVLELDQKARRDLFLLAQSGKVGRAHANKLLWRVLTGPALDPTYQDLSNLVTSWVYKARRQSDRPPREHADLKWWWWTCYESLHKKDTMWAPEQVPGTHWYVHVGLGDRPPAAA